jgi:hypothetical protein
VITLALLTCPPWADNILAAALFVVAAIAIIRYT